LKLGKIVFEPVPAINTKQLLKQLVARTGYKPGVVEGTLMELVDLVGEYIGQGYRVDPVIKNYLFSYKKIIVLL